MLKGAIDYCIRKPSNTALIAVFSVFAFVFSIGGLWKEDRNVIDVPAYYAYLPSGFIYHDLTLNYVDKDPAFFDGKIWFVKAPNGGRLIKKTMGMSILYAPFFFLGHGFALLSGSPADGFSLPYQNALSIGFLFYVLMGFIFLQRTLRYFFSEKASALCILVLGIGSNLLWYSTYELLMPHSSLFALFSTCSYFFIRWLKEEKKSFLFLFALTWGIIYLIRPPGIIWLVFYVLLAIQIKSYKGFLQLLRSQFPAVCISFLLAISISLPQLLYWKYITGSYLINPYEEGEVFLWSRPQLINFLFSFRKGWFIYSPLLLLIVPGFYFLFRKHRELFFSTLPPLLLSIYVLASWWCWSYGPTFGMRPMVDFYGFIAFPLCAFFEYILTKGRPLISVVGTFLFLGVCFNLFQNWQYKKGLIDPNDMTREAYFTGVFQTKASSEWYDQLEPYDYFRHVKGLPQVKYSPEYFASLGVKDYLYLRGSNFKYLSIVDDSSGILSFNAEEPLEKQLFHLIRLEKDTIAIKASNGKYLRVFAQSPFFISASGNSIGVQEKFVLNQLRNGSNQISLMALNGLYLSLVPQWDYTLCANGYVVGREEKLRVYKLEIVQ